MSKQSRVEQKKQEEQEKIEEVEETKEMPTVKPVVVATVGRKKSNKGGRFNKKPKSVSQPAKNDPESAALLEKLADAQMRSEKSIEKLAEAQVQLSEQVCQDHQVLTDHEWRIHDVETFLGIVPKSERPAAKGQSVVRKQSLTEEQPLVEEQLSVEEEQLPAEEQPVEVSKPSQSDSTNQPDIPKGTVPREMYEAKVFENDMWVWYGPYSKISRAEQAVNGDLSKVRIVQVWYDNDHDVVIRRLTAEELDRYCK